MDLQKTILDRGGVRIKLKEDNITVSECRVAVSNGIWSISEWFTARTYRHQGYGKQVLREAFNVLSDEYGSPTEIRYNWNGVNEYVLEWMNRHFSPQSIISDVERKYGAEQSWEAHIFILDKEKVFNYIKE